LRYDDVPDRLPSLEPVESCDYNILSLTLFACGDKPLLSILWSQR
jgi:hypothetical protein